MPREPQQAEGKIELDDAFFVSPIDSYSGKPAFHAEAIGNRTL